MIVQSKRERLAASVIPGDDGFLFHDEHGALAQLAGRRPLTADELGVWVRELESRAARCAAQGVAFRVLFVPEKHVIYSDKFRGEPISPIRPVMQVLAALSPEVRAMCLYPVIELQSSRNRFETYFRTDTHWTGWGAFRVLNTLLDSLSGQLTFDRIVEADITERERPYIGDLGVRLDPEQEEIETYLWHDRELPFKPVFDNKVFARGSTTAYTSPRVEAPRLLIYRDSFFNYIIPHMIPVFSRVVAVSTIDMHVDLLESERPDPVIFEIAERFVGNRDENGVLHLPKDSDVSFTEFSGVDLDVLRQAG